VDPRIDEILQITKDTNRMVRKMRRSQLWGRFYQVVWWLAIIAISGAAYYYYAQPYVDRLTQLYAQMEQGSQQVQSVSSQLSSFFGNWLPSSAPSASSGQAATTTAK
jgi:hypothetical protein